MADLARINWSSVPRAREARQLGGRTPWFTGGWPVRSLAIDPRQRFVLTAGNRGMRLFHAATGELERVFEAQPFGVSSEQIGFSADGTLAFARYGAFHDPARIGVWDVATGAFLRDFGGPVARVMAVDRQGTRAICANNHGVTLWDLGTEKPLHHITRDRGGFGASTFIGPRADRAVVALASESALLWNLESGEVIWQKKIGQTYSLAAPADGDWFAAGSGFRQVRVHDLESGKTRRTLGTATPKPYGNDISTLCSADDGRRLVGVAGVHLLVWDVETGAALLEEDLPPYDDQPVAQLAASGAWVVTGGRSGVLRRFELNGSKPAPLPTGTRHGGRVVRVAIAADGMVYSTDGTTTLAWGEDGHAHGIRKGDGPPEMRASEQDVRFTGASRPPWYPRLEGCISGEEQRQDRTSSAPVVGPTIAANIMQDGEVVVWDLAISEEPIQSLQPGTDPSDTFPARAIDIALHPDGRRIAIACNRGDAPVQIWDARKGVPLLICEGHESDARSVAFSSDGKLLASGSDDRTVRVHRVDDSRSD